MKKGEFSDLLRDVDVLSQISHPNIIRMDLFSLQEKGRDLVIGMPRGEPITGYITRMGIGKKTTAFRRLIYELLCGLDILHRAGILHADLKPENIVVVNGIASMIDFGISCFLNPLCIYNTQISKDICIDGNVLKGWIYTPRYRAPEVVPGRFITSKADIFALGKILETLYIGDPYIDSNIPIPTSDPILRDLLPRMLHPDPEKREDASVLMNHQYFQEVKDPCMIGTSYVPIVPSKTKISISSQLFYVLCEWIIDLFIKYDINIHALFLIIHNIHRSSQLATKDNLLLFGIVNMDLVISEVLNTIPDVENSLSILRSKFTEQQYIDLRSKTITLFEGTIVTPTYWNIARAGEELIPLLVRSIRWTYSGPDSSYLPILRGRYSKWLSSRVLITWFKDTKPLSQYIETIKYDEDAENELLNPKHITYIPTPPILGLRDTIDKIRGNLFDGISYVYQIQDLMRTDRNVANTILDTLMHVNGKYRTIVEGYDIIFGKEKLTLWDKPIKSLNINVYTSSYEDILIALNK